MPTHVNWPLSYNLIRGRSERNTFGDVRTNKDGSKRAHQGWDFEAAIGTAVYAIADGQVAFVKTNEGPYGTQICHDFEFDGRTLYAFYAHLSSILVKTGDTVRRGEMIGATGDSGNARGQNAKENHLHFEIRERAVCGTGLAGRISPLKVYGTCPLHEPARQNLSAAASVGSSRPGMQLCER